MPASGKPVITVKEFEGSSATIDLAGRKYYTVASSRQGNSQASPVIIGKPSFVGNAKIDLARPWPEMAWWTFTDGGTEVDAGLCRVPVAKRNSWTVDITGDAKPRTVRCYLSWYHPGAGKSEYRFSAGDVTLPMQKERKLASLFEVVVQFSGTITVRLQPTDDVGLSNFHLAAIVVD